MCSHRTVVRTTHAIHTSHDTTATATRPGKSKHANSLSPSTAYALTLHHKQHLRSACNLQSGVNVKHSLMCDAARFGCPYWPDSYQLCWYTDGTAHPLTYSAHSLLILIGVHYLSLDQVTPQRGGGGPAAVVYQVVVQQAGEQRVPSLHSGGKRCGIHCRKHLNQQASKQAASQPASQQVKPDSCNA
jgi:hypothetical protein